MNERHRNADVIIAFAEGKTIQFRDTPGGPNGDDGVYKNWTDYKESNSTPYGFGPLWSSPKVVEWRIKPEKHKEWLAIGNSGLSWIDSAKDYAIKGFQREYKSKPIACIEIEYEEGDGL